MAATGDDDFNQFLDMSTVAGLGGDAMPFDFDGFHDAAAQHVLAQSRSQPDTIMADSDPASLHGPRSDGLLQSHAAPMASHMMAASAPDDAISTIDAQIQYLERQKHLQQQRALHDQRAGFFSSHHGHSVPPTPQSLEMPPAAAHFYAQSDHVARQAGPYDAYHHHQRMAEQHDVSRRRRAPDWAQGE